MDAVNALIVPAIIGLMMFIKSKDPEDKMKRFYGLFCIVLSVVGGFGYAYIVQGSTVDAALVTAGLTYGAVQAIWATKQAIGVRIAGDSSVQSSVVSADNVGK